MRQTLPAAIRLFASMLVLVWGSAVALAHEFWISPEAYQIAAGDPIVANLRVGEKLTGSAYPFLPRNTERFEIYLNGEQQEVTSRIGDRPALNQPLNGDGLAIVVHETTDLTLTYRKWEKFEAFTNHKGFSWAQDKHRARGLPETGFKEAYRRFAKSLVSLGGGKGEDMTVGLETEIVALANPYSYDLSTGLPVQVLFRGEPRSDVQVEVFERPPDGDVAVSLHQTNEDGIAIIPLDAGTEYLIDAVVMLTVEPEEEGGPVWRSLWASLTFRAPDL